MVPVIRWTISLSQLLPSEQGPNRQYYRFQQDLLEEGNDEMDDASEKHLSALNDVAQILIQEKSDELNELVCKLVSSL